MLFHVDPTFKDELKEFGVQNIQECWNCGNCTAVCSHSETVLSFPRPILRMMALGMRNALDHTIEPWLCYYCGECAQACPKQANPAENMMAVRRYLTSRYDWTGISRRLYLSTAAEIGMLAIIAGIVVLLFIAGHFFTRTPLDVTRVDLQTLVPLEAVHFGDWALALFLLFFLGTNAIRMFKFVLGDLVFKIPLKTYLAEAKTFILHLFTQMEWRKCEQPTRWWKHFLLFIAYATMLLLVVLFLPWFQRNDNQWHWTSLLGYYAAGILMWFSFDALSSRQRREEMIHKFSHLTDWMYLILLFLTGLSGMLLHLSRLLNLPWPTYILYVVHLAIAVPMLVVEVPFGKWSHLIYRPLAMYLHRLQMRVIAEMPKIHSSRAWGTAQQH